MTGLLKDKGVDIRRFFYYFCCRFAGSVACFFGYTDKDRVFSLVSVVQSLGILKGVCRNNPVIMVSRTYHNGRIIDAFFYVMEGRVSIKIFKHLLTVLAASVFIDPSPAYGKMLVAEHVQDSNLRDCNGKKIRALVCYGSY